jgi:ATP-dependent DNA helicase RecQ
MNYEYLLALREHFGYGSFKKGQEEIIEAIMGGSDVLGIMPTGSGKSICYQIPALLLPGITLVISPLISLMKDQVDALAVQGVPATFINSTLDRNDVEKRIKLVAGQKYKLLYIAPERLESERFRDFLKSMPISLVAVDEAHCVSQWGHDFRPSYLSIAPVINQLPKRPVAAAFTATATDAVRQDIARLLSLREPKVFIGGYDRENLRFSVEKPRDKDAFVLEYIRSHREQSGIIYAATRKQTEKLAESLSAKGIPTCKYHAGMEDGERNEAQDAFARDIYSVMAATNAFGMGIDKSNVRFILHYNMPRDIESYYQEAGRAGRDDLPADCVLLYGAGDVSTQRFLIDQSPDATERAREYARLKEMVAYCHSSRCLRKLIREYFGETGVPESCGNCGNCDITETEDITIEAQKILSCVKRMGEGYGVALTASVLKGSRAKRIQELHFDTLSTYGIMKEMHEREIANMIQYLVSEGYLQLAGDKYPVLYVSERAQPVLRKAETVTRPARKAHPVKKERSSEKVRRLKTQEAEADPALFEALRSFRTEAARRENVPPYVVFHDSTLREICQRLPIDTASLLDVPGMGRRKLERYGDAILRIVAAHHTEESFHMPPEDANGLEDTDDVTESHVITYELVALGYKIEDVAAERRIAVSTAIEHLLRCGREGMAIAWEELIPRDAEELILAKIKEIGCNRLKLLKEALPERIDYGTIQAVIAKNGLG